MSWFVVFQKDRQCGPPGCSTGSWSRLKNGGRLYARRRGTRRIWAIFATCTVCCYTRATCFLRSVMKMPRS